ncbi:MAG: RNA methyltransferase [Chloroflexi bacterium]|nr:RNA methyltransferase [Chloroflexota bacterium]
MITSLSNSKVKLVRSLARRPVRYATEQFVVEGVRLVEEVMGAGITPALVFYTRAVEQEPRAAVLLERLRAVTPEVYAVADAVMKAMSKAETPPGILTVVPFMHLPIPPEPQFVLILDAVRDPGNVGTILRGARAVGVDLVLFAPDTADPYNEKVVRAAMGAHFRVPLRVEHSWDAIAETVRGMARIYLADANGETVYTQVGWMRPLALIIGGEAEGAGPPARQVATARLRIPMQGDTESLNAAMAATLLLFEAARHREDAK